MSAMLITFYLYYLLREAGSLEMFANKCMDGLAAGEYSAFFPSYLGILLHLCMEFTVLKPPRGIQCFLESKAQTFPSPQPLGCLTGQVSRSHPCATDICHSLCGWKCANTMMCTSSRGAVEILSKAAVWVPAAW